MNEEIFEELESDSLDEDFLSEIFELNEVQDEDQYVFEKGNWE